jgi:hypothetical protein
MSAMPHAVLLLVLAGACAAGAVAVWLMGRRRRPKNDVFAALGTTATAARARVAAPPVDLRRPIDTEEAWAAMRNHAADAAYRRAVDLIRGRYRLVGNPMLLPNTLKEAMGRAGLSFREAVIRVAQDDGLHGHR